MKGDEAKGHFANYSEYSKTLRAWLVAYGIGGPVLVATNDVLQKIVRDSALHKPMVVFFFLGVAGQVLLAFVNKWCAYNMYLGIETPSYQKKRRYKFWDWLNEKNLLDLFIDLASLACFAVATWLFLKAVL